MFVDAGRFPLAELRAATRDVRDQIELAGSSGVTLVQALETALGFEQEMVEREAYQVFASDSLNVAARAQPPARLVGATSRPAQRHAPCARPG